MAELLLELLSEEIPARLQRRAADDLGRLLGAALKEADLAFEQVATYATPRRLALVMRGLAAKQPDVQVEKRGPRVGAPAEALSGFVASLGVADYQLEEQDDKRGRVHVARYLRVGRSAADVLVPVLGEILARFPWPKSMRWGAHAIRWVRPLHGILCLLDGAVVPVRFGPLEATASTRGHRFLAPVPIAARDFEDYRQKLTAAYVQLDGADRQKEIAGEAARLARAENLRLRSDSALIGELAGLVEWPVVLPGRIDQRFMALPEEVLVTSMRQHQKYLALEDASGKLAPRFLVVANIPAEDGGRAIVAGNERVLRARLWDAQFFWDQDRKRPLASRVPELEGVVFHARLGSLGAKVARLQSLATWLAQRVPNTRVEHAARAALLCKADLVTGMVGEFPELQGVMGRYYAEHDLEQVDVAEAIARHYAPQGPNDVCPTAPVSVTVGLADRLDTLAGFFAVGEKPTGSKDPYALRRAALGVIRLILENRLRLPLRAAFQQALAGYGEQLAGVEPNAVTAELLEFFADRLRVHLKGGGRAPRPDQRGVRRGRRGRPGPAARQGRGAARFPRDRGRRQPSDRASAREQHRAHRGEAGRPVLCRPARRTAPPGQGGADAVLPPDDRRRRYCRRFGAGRVHRCHAGARAAAPAGRRVLRAGHGQRRGPGPAGQPSVSSGPDPLGFGGGRRLFSDRGQRKR